jgi:hypothetical protein
LDVEQKTSVDKPDERSSQPSGSQTADVTAVPAVSSSQEDVISGERQQHGALPDLLPPQIPPRANQPDKTSSEEVCTQFSVHLKLRVFISYNEDDVLKKKLC